MHRCALPATLAIVEAAGVSGCLASVTGAHDCRTASIVERDGVPAGLDIRLDARDPQPSVTSDGTARVRVTLTNTGPVRRIGVRTCRYEIFN